MIAIGTRVRLAMDVENYPIGIWKAGETGTLVSVDSEYLFVRLDQHYDELNEWENELQVWDGSELNGPEFTMWKYVEAIEGE